MLFLIPPLSYSEINPFNYPILNQLQNNTMPIEQLIIDGKVYTVRKKVFIKKSGDGTTLVKTGETWERYNHDTKSWEFLTSEELALFYSQKYAPRYQPVSRDPSEWPAVERDEVQSAVERNKLVEVEREDGQQSCACGWYYVQCTCGCESGFKYGYRCGLTVDRYGNTGSATTAFCPGVIPEHRVRGLRVSRGCNSCR